MLQYYVVLYVISNKYSLHYHNFGYFIPGILILYIRNTDILEYPNIEFIAYKTIKDTFSTFVTKLQIAIS